VAAQLRDTFAAFIIAVMPFCWHGFNVALLNSYCNSFAKLFSTNFTHPKPTDVKKPPEGGLVGVGVVV
jgi:hypothetical protein